MNANIESFEAIEIARRIEKAIDGFGVGAGRFREADDGAIGFGHDARGVRGIIEQAGSLALSRASNSRANSSACDFVGSGVFPFRKFFERSGAEAIEELRIESGEPAPPFRR